MTAPETVVLDKPVRILGDAEKLISIGHDVVNSWQLVYAVFLKGDIIERHVRHGLQNLQLLHENLRVTVREVDGQLGFYLAGNDQFPYEMCDHEDWRQEYDIMISTRYDQPGHVLWQAKFFPSVPLPTAADSATKRPLILLGFHHMIIDGVTCLTLIARMMECLNAASKGESLEGDYKMGDSVMDKVVKRHKVKLSQLPLYLSLGKTLSADFMPQIVKKFGYPENPDGTMHSRCYIPTQLTVEETDVFLKKCKSEGCTVTSALTAAMFLSQWKMLTEDGAPRKIKLKASQQVNMRRYGQDDDKSAMTYGTSAIYISVNVNGKKNNSLWRLGRTYKKRLHNGLHKNIPVMFAKIHLKMFKSGKLTWQDFLKNPNDSSADFTISSVGNFDEYFPERPIDVNLIVQSSNMVYLSEFLLINVFTVGGRLMVSVDYLPHLVTEEVAAKIMEGAIEILKEQIR